MNIDLINEYKERIKMRLKRYALVKLGCVSDQKFFLDSHMQKSRNDGVVRIKKFSELEESRYLLPARNEVVTNYYLPRYIYSLEGATVDPLTNIVYDKSGKFIAESSAWNPLRLLYSCPKPYLKIPKKMLSGEYVFLPNIGYYHWLIEELPAFLAAIHERPDALIVHSKKISNYGKTLLGWLNKEHMVIDKPTRFDTLIMTGKTAGQGNPLFGLTPQPSDLKVLRRCFDNLIEKENKHKKLKLYLSREGEKRCPRNHREVLQIMNELGFTIFDAKDNMTFLDQIKLFSAAEFVVGIHGAAFSNLAWCQRDCQVLEIFSEQYMPSCYSNIASMRGLKYNFYCHAGTPEADINIDEFTKFLSAILRSSN